MGTNWIYIAMALLSTAACKPKAGSSVKSYDALVNQQRTAQTCWLSDGERTNLAQSNPSLYRTITSEWDQSQTAVAARLTSDSVAPPESMDALRKVWLATPAGIRSLFTSPESDARIRLADRSTFSSLCAPPNRGTASGEAVDLQACWRVEASTIVMTVLNEPAVIHRVFIPAIVATTMETRLQANRQELTAMQAGLRGSLHALGEATVGDFQGSEVGRNLTRNFQNRFGAADSAQLSASIPFQILALAELLDAAYYSRETYQQFVTASELPMPKSVAAIAQWSAADAAQEPWFFKIAGKNP